MRLALSILLIISIIAVFAFTVNGEEMMGTHHKGMQQEEMLQDSWYVCSCNDCNCNTLSKQPGKCICGRELVPARLLKIDGNKGYFCRCGAECSCKLDSEDLTKCSCGNQVSVIDLSGKYVCSCCNIISEKPSRCFCGKELEKLE